ncbi:MAG: PEBP family protein [Candidatus Nomurabacteria bacterium GW2011_GWB1_37_5]|uniref:PEBP family protein n=1 Tax=Candidatus Nomurabacteria bacterium GW2011_GWB1_37_5 TaxID=1618742 RepID=A0A0G0K452_9BACT|nr:MAG: PEBP family protein [Candidatus Nomurabacteria bacterium GW2011_GWB1_37_5]
MKIESPAFKNNNSIPSIYTCDGAGTNPSLIFSDIPAEAKSLALIMDDPDIPETAKQSFGIEVWDHWVLFNIPPNTTEIKEGINPPGVLGVNTRSNLAYGSPCPPDREHRYFFKLYALDAILDLKPGATKKELESAMQGHIIARAELVGRYNKIK